MDKSKIVKTIANNELLKTGTVINAFYFDNSIYMTINNESLYLWHDKTCFGTITLEAIKTIA